MSGAVKMGGEATIGEAGQGRRLLTPNRGCTMTDALLKPAEAAAYLGISLGTLYNWSSQRKIPVVKLGGGKRGGLIRFRRDALERFVSKHERRALA